VTIGENEALLTLSPVLPLCAQAASFAEFNGLKAGSLSMKAEAQCLFQAVSKQTAVKVRGCHSPSPALVLSMPPLALSLH